MKGRHCTVVGNGLVRPVYNEASTEGEISCLTYNTSRLAPMFGPVGLRQIDSSPRKIC